jgi:glycosyltransferase involved in cell wall biosynthesis
VLVVDSFSTDRTASIAKEHGARVLTHEYVNSATQKNWALPHASNPWVLVVDADERVTTDLRREVEHLLAAGPKVAAYSIPRVNFFMNRRIRHGGWEADRVIRLIRPAQARYQDREVHAEVVTNGPIGRLSAPLLHYTFRSFAQYLPKVQRYTDWGASQAFRDGQRAGVASVLLRPVGRFFKMYVLRLGFLDGRHGMVLGLLAAFSVYLKYAKLWEMGLKEREAQEG